MQFMKGRQIVEMTQVYYYLKRTQATAKEEEFCVPVDLRAKRDIETEKLFPLTISMLGDISGKIIRSEEIKIERMRKQLELSAKFFSSYYATRGMECYDDYLLLLAAVCYYFIGQVGSAYILVDKIFTERLSELGGLAVALYQMLSGKKKQINTEDFFYEEITLYLEDFFQALVTNNNPKAEYWKNLRNKAYRDGSPRDILLVDILIAIGIKKNENSTYKLLLQYSSLSEDNILEMLDAETIITELWPSQKIMAEKGFFRGESGIVQLPTGAGKTKAIALCIYSYLSGVTNGVSVVVTPFRALCREVSSDLRKSLGFAKQIQIVEISDLLQNDYVFDLLSEKDKKSIIVLTPEKLLFILEQDPLFVGFIGQIIFDEGHLFEDESRGVQFELLVSRILANIAADSQKILISAIVGGVESLNKWITKGDGGVVTDENFVPAEKNIIALNSSIFQKKIFYQLEYINKKNLTNVDYYVPRIFEQIKVDDSIVFPRDCNDQSIAVMMRLIQKDNCAIFCGTKKNVDSIINRIIELAHIGIWSEGLIERNNQEEQNKIANLYQVTYGDINLYEAAKMGIFAHHSAISDGIKASVEFALQKALITNIICTSTLAQGVNMPIKYMIFTSLFQGGKPMGVKDFQNLVGRVGRPGMYLEGNIVFADVDSYKKRTWQWDNFKRMFLGNKENSYSRLRELCTEHQMSEDGKILSFYNFIIKLYASNKKEEAKLDAAFKKLDELEGGSKLNWTSKWQYIKEILGTIEWFVANYKDIHSMEQIKDLTNWTLVINHLDDSQKQQLDNIFMEIIKYVNTIFTDVDAKYRFSKSLLPSRILCSF